MRALRHHRNFCISLLMLGFVAGCTYIGGSRDTISPGFDKDEKRTGSFVFGYIDMKEADPDLDWALLYHFAQGEQTKSIPMRTSEGAYYLENVPPGSYSIGEFGGRATNFFSAGALIAFRPYFYTIGTEPAFRVKIEKPGIYFVGAHKFQPHKSDKSGSDKFELNPLDSPTQKEILAKIVERAKGSPWEPALRSYLAKLK